MKIKILFFGLGLSLLIASCTDKKGAEELAKIKTDMRKADSICMADKTMLMDSIAAMNMRMDSMMAAMPVKNTTSSSTKSTASKTTTTTTTKTEPKGVTNKSGATNTTEGTEKKADVKKKGGATQTGGN